MTRSFWDRFGPHTIPLNSRELLVQRLCRADPGTTPPHTELGDEALTGLLELAIQAPAGHFVEVGVYHGGSAWWLSKITHHRGCQLHLFDTWNGIPFQDQGDFFRVGEFLANVDDVRHAIPSAHCYPGLFPETLPADLDNIAFAHIDCDQYRSVRDCIEYLWPLMVPGGIMVFDDAPYLGSAEQAVVERFSRDQIIPLDSRCYVQKPL